MSNSIKEIKVWRQSHNGRWDFLEMQVIGDGRIIFFYSVNKSHTNEDEAI